MGVLELLFTAVTCMLAITNASSASASAALPNVNITMPNCEAQCGEVNIPFPFGIGSDCSLNKWFEIFCNKSTTPHRLFLKHTQWEVLNISDLFTRTESAQDLQIKNPITFSKCGDNETGKSFMNLTGSPFSFSWENTFVAVGCGVYAKIDSSSSDKFYQEGCKSVCSTGDQFNSTSGNASTNGILCDGVDCCETRPTGTITDSFHILFENGSTTDSRSESKCKFAFMVDGSYWNEYKNKSTSSLATVADMVEYAPVTLYWSVYYTYIKKIFGTTNMSWPASKLYSKYVYCNWESDESYSSTPKCYCNQGFQGNPYLVGGCSQDINECELYSIECGRGGTCVNAYGSYHCSYKLRSIAIGVGSSLGALFLLFGTLGLYKFIKKSQDIRRKRKFFKRNGGLLLQQQLSSVEGNIQKTKLFNSNELRKATNNFSIDRILGQGGQGTVYKGMLEDGKIVAIKKSKVVDEAQLSGFINEVVILSQINHRNVVQLLGCCLETEVPLLVYEFISNGTLSQYIHVRNVELPFTWKMRLRVATEVAGALSYLHSAASFAIYHRDIKSANILLDEKYKAKVADFGTSRTISVEQTHLTTIVYGTFGYLDPEYFQSSQFTDKSDVYSFGVVLVELLTGQKAIPVTWLEEGKNLASHFVMTMEAGGNVFDIIDPQVAEDASEEEVGLVANLAQRCLNLNGRNRPTMKEVTIALEGIQRPERAASGFQQNHEEVEYVMTLFNEPWDDDYTSTASALEKTTSTSTSFPQEVPILSIELC